MEKTRNDSSGQGRGVGKMRKKQHTINAYDLTRRPIEQKKHHTTECLGPDEETHRIKRSIIPREALCALSGRQIRKKQCFKEAYMLLHA